MLFHGEKFCFGVNFQLSVPELTCVAADAPWSFADQHHPWFPLRRRKQCEHLGSLWKCSITAAFPLHQPHGETLGLCTTKVSLYRSEWLLLGGRWNCSALVEQITEPGQAGGAGGRFLSLEENGMESGWGRPWEESIPPWGRQGTAVPQCHPALYGTRGGIQCKEGQPALGPAWQEGALLAPQPPQTTAWPCPVAWPGVHRGDRVVLPAILCSPQGAASSSGVHPSWLGLETGRLWALCTLGSFKSQVLGGFLFLSPFAGEPETPLLSSALLLLPQLSRPLLCLPKDTALVLLAAPRDTRGLREATSWAVTVPPREKTGRWGRKAAAWCCQRLHTRLSPQGRFALLLKPPKSNST